jgi:hypothetical protein
VKRLLLAARSNAAIGVTAVMIGMLSAGTAIPAALASHHHTRHHHKRHHHSSTTRNCIPQGNVGDNDTDNHGGPSDGDGCL